MTVLLNLNYRIYDAAAQADRVGWPRPTGAQPLSVYQRMVAAMPDYAASGFGAIGLPPSTLGRAGIFSAGYDLFDPYALDGTAFGEAEDLRHLVAVAHAAGLKVHGDLVLHQMGGGRDGVYATRRFPKTPECFVGEPPRVGVDDVPDAEGNFAFGDMCSYQHSVPAGYMLQGAVAATQFLVATTGFDGLRIDDAKGTYSPVIYDILHAPGLEHVVATYEYFDGSPGPVRNYVNGYQHRRGSVLDFAAKFNLGGICDNNSRAWMGHLAHIGWLAEDPYTAVTFVESADSDTSPGQQTIWNKLLAYAVIMTFPGAPSVYYRDWSHDAGCYGLKAGIDNLVWIHNNLVGGEFVVRLGDEFQIFVMERMGWGDAPGCVCAFNNDQWHSYERTVQTHFAPGTRLHEYTGNAPYNSDVWCDGSGRITLTIPPNDNGRGVVIYGPASLKGAPALAPIATVQSFFGASDLPIGPLVDGTLVIGGIKPAAGSWVTLSLTPDRDSWFGVPSVNIQILDEAGVAWATLVYAGDEPVRTQHQSYQVPAGGDWMSLTATCQGLPVDGCSFQLDVTYLGAA